MALFRRRSVRTEEPTAKKRDWHRESPFRIPLRQDIWRRIRPESPDVDPLSGREQQVEFLASMFRGQASGSILITGPRGVGKTTLVDRALFRARRALSVGAGDPEWRRSPWRSTELPGGPLLTLKLTVADLAGQEPAAAPKQKPRKGKRRKAMPGAVSATQLSHEVVLRAMVRKVYSECHGTRRTPQSQRIAAVLERERYRQFTALLETTYNRAASRALKSELSQREEDSASQRFQLAADHKDALRALLGYIPAAVLGVAAWWCSVLGWEWPFRGLTGLAVCTAGISSWPALKVAWRREWKSERSRKAAESYEFDYGSTQIADDLQRLLRLLTTPDGAAPFRRIVFVFDELDKLAQPLKSLSAVLHHFKNLYTLSDALFVFITDDLFYRQWQQALRRTERKLRYAPEHTYFTQVIYLRKPDFVELRHFVYGLFSDEDLKVLLKALEGDRELVAYLIDALEYSNLVYASPDSAPTWVGFDVHDLWIELWDRRARIDAAKISAVTLQLSLIARGEPELFALAWIRLATSSTTPEMESLQHDVDWSHGPAVTLLHYYRHHFPPSLQRIIEDAYTKLGQPPVTWQATVTGRPMNFTDLVRYLVFRARNHYFDLQRELQSYLRMTPDGPTLEFDPYADDHTRILRARFQEMVEMVYESFQSPEWGQDFYNQILLESLYRVFHSYEDGVVTTVGKLRLTRPNARATTPDDQTSLPERRREEIDRAVERLLQMLQQRRAITFEPDVDRLLDLERHADRRIIWTNTCELVVSRRGIPLNDEELALSQFWEAHRAAYLEMQRALNALWIGVSRGETWQWEYRTRLTSERIETLLRVAQPLALGVGSVSRSRARRLAAESPSSSELLADVPKLFADRAKHEVGTTFVDGFEREIGEMVGKFEKTPWSTALSGMSSSYYINLVPEAGVVVLFRDLFTAGELQATREFLATYPLSVVWAVRAVAGDVSGDGDDPVRYVRYESPSGLEKVFDVFQELVGRARAAHVLKTSTSPAAMLAAAADVFGRVSDSNPWVTAVRGARFETLVPDLRRVADDSTSRPAAALVDLVGRFGVGGDPESIAREVALAVCAVSDTAPEAMRSRLLAEAVKRFVRARLPVEKAPDEFEVGLETWTGTVVTKLFDEAGFLKLDELEGQRVGVISAYHNSDEAKQAKAPAEA